MNSTQIEARIDMPRLIEAKTFGVAAGIGDLSWVYSKLKNIGQPLVFHVADGWPRRSVPFLKLLPNMAHAEYSPHSWHDLQAFQRLHPAGTYQELKDRNFGVEYLENNMHLLSGRRLEEWLPDLPTDFHYEMNVPVEDMARAKFLWEKHGLRHPCMAISCASYKGSEAWNTWGVTPWLEFLRLIKHEVPEMQFILIGGFWDDLTATIADTGGFIDLVGKTSIGTCIELLKRIDYYVGFCSGLGVLRTVLNKKVFTLWPDIHDSHIWSWVPPKMAEDGTYVGMLWREPEFVFARVKKWMAR